MFKFLSESEYLALDTKAQQAYDKAAAEFAAKFRISNPNGKTAAFEITRMALPTLSNPRFSIVVKSTEFAPRSTNGTSAFQYTAKQVERLAGSANLAGAGSLFGLIAGSIEPLKLEVTIRPVLTGEEYTKADGTTGTYKIASMRYENESIVLSHDAKSMITASVNQLLVDDMKAIGRRLASASAVSEEQTV